MDSLGNPIQGASVRLSPGNKGTSTAADGSFTIANVNPGNYTLEISLVGHFPIRRSVSVTDNMGLSLGNIILSINPDAMQEVTISTGYQKISKERFVGSYSQLDSQAYHRRVGMGIIERLDGNVTGYYLMK